MLSKHKNKPDKEQKNSENEASEINIDTSIVSRFLKNKPAYKAYIILLFLILVALFGTWFLPGSYKTPGRVYNLDVPSIGYHNMKENEYLSQALNMPRYHDYLRRIMHIFGMDSGPGYFEEYPQMPLLPWMFLLSWLVFGFHFWAARIIIVLFSFGSLIFIYLITKKLTSNNETIALTAAALFAIMPLGVFFGRNIQPEMPALFSILVGVYFFIKWFDEWHTKDFALSAVGFMLAGIFKPTFLIAALPLLAIFPYKDFWDKLKHQKQRITILKQGALFIAILLPVIIWNFVISAMLNTRQGVMAGTIGRVHLFVIFTPAYWANAWPAIDAYIRDNYAVWYLMLAIFGVLLLLIGKRNSRLAKFLFVYALAVIPYSMILSDYIKGHSYYQMPFLPLVCIASAYFIYAIADFGKQILNQKTLPNFFTLLTIYSILLSIIYAIVKTRVNSYTGAKTGLIQETIIVFIFVFILILAMFFIAHRFEKQKKHVTANAIVAIISISTIIITLPAVKTFTDAQYNTVFFGLDAAADYLKSHSKPEERFYFEGHSQSLGVCFNSDRRCGAAMNLTEMQFGEQERNMSWYFLHGDLGIYNLYNKKDIFPYVQDNYGIVQVTFITQDQKTMSRPMTYLLKKGGKSNLTNLGENELFRAQPKLVKTYNIPSGTYYLYSVQLE